MLVICHLELAEANAFVAALHRHHKKVQGHRYSIGVKNGDALVGVAIVGRPQARMTDQRNTVEVLRLCTDGTKNACSLLYSACARAARELGYTKIQTFILDTEPGVTLRAAGWSYEHTSDGGEWTRPSRERRQAENSQPKQRWAKLLTETRKG